MKIASIQAVQAHIPPRPGPRTEARRPPWAADDEVANPMSKFPRYKRYRSSWLPKWPGVWVKVTAEDGTWGLGMTSYGRATAAVIDDHLGPLLVGEECLAIEKCWDMMFRASKPYGTAGIASCAISGIDLALWDLAGKIVGKPVYELLGGPFRDQLFAYATGNDVDWYLECGFRAVKLACPYGPADGLDGLRRNEDLVARTRELCGDEVEIMLDCYMAFDVEYTVRLAERLKPYRLKWIEEFLLPEDLEGHIQVRQRVPWQTLAGGEHLFTAYPFRQLIEHRALDILQPDIFWIGGLTPTREVCHLANAAGINVILHGGGMNQYGLHLSAAMPNTAWCEYFVGSPPGVPLEEARGVNASVVPVNSAIFPGNGPGFGLDIREEWLSPFFA
ncbi:L-rhamnonate dehydratase [Candidatus Poribacteria bacterium]|nr:L-rhamnonate dehydratase [Candidatus Poribacteria bacterium]